MNDPVNDPVSAPPVLRVVRGQATDEELAALVAVLLARAVPAPRATPGPASTWSDPAARLRGRVPWTPGPDAWRTFRRPG